MVPFIDIPDSKFPGTNMGPIWGRQDPGRPHVGTMNFAIWDLMGWCRVVQVLIMGQGLVYEIQCDN